MTIALERDNNWAILCAWKCNCATVTHSLTFEILSICCGAGGWSDRMLVWVMQRTMIVSSRSSDSLHGIHIYCQESQLYSKPMTSTLFFLVLCRFFFVVVGVVVVVVVVVFRRRIHSFRFNFMQIIWWSSVFVELLHALFVFTIVSPVPFTHE